LQHKHGLTIKFNANCYLVLIEVGCAIKVTLALMVVALARIRVMTAKRND